MLLPHWTSLETSILTPQQEWKHKNGVSNKTNNKKSLKFPRRTISVFLHTPRKYVGLGITSLEDQFDMIQIKRAFHFLTSPDKTLQNVAWSQLTTTIKHRRSPGQKGDLSEKDVKSFLNSPPEKQEKHMRDVRTI